MFFLLCSIYAAGYIATGIVMLMHGEDDRTVIMFACLFWPAILALIVACMPLILLSLTSEYIYKKYSAEK